MLLKIDIVMSGFVAFVVKIFEIDILLGYMKEREVNYVSLLLY